MEVKWKMKRIARKVAAAAIAAAIVFGSVQAAGFTAEAKGTAFINKKISSVTPTIKSAKRSNGKVNVTVTVPASKVKKLGKVKKITVSYGSTKDSRKFQAARATAKVTRKGKNQYTFSLNSKKLNSYKTAYMAVRFDGKSNWSKLAKVSGKAGQVIVTYHLQCQCGKEWTNHTGFAALSELWGKHVDEIDKKADEDAGFVPAGSGENGEVVSVDDILNIGAGLGKHGSYKTWYTTGTSN